MNIVLRSCCRQLTIQSRPKCIRFKSSQSIPRTSRYPSKRSFPLDLPEDFQFSSQSITYSNGILLEGNRSLAAPKSTIKVDNPATEETLIRIDVPADITVRQTIREARKVFESGVWSRKDPTERFHVLNRIAALLRKHIEGLAALETMQTGRPIREMRTQLSRIPEWIEYHASLARTWQSDVLPFKGNVLNYTKTQPLGVVALITPWNHPLLITIKKLAPALAAGNSIIIKPSEKAPLSVQYFVSNILAKAGVPLGTVQVLLGDPRTATSILTPPNIQDIERVDFTGGTVAGSAVAELAGKYLKPVTLELGGKSAVLICEDCDIEQGVEGVLTAGFIASGQTCVTGSRIIIHESIYDKFVWRLMERTKELKVGLPWEEDTQIGPLIDAAAVDRCEAIVSTTFSDTTAIRIAGGRTARVNATGTGYFYAPTIIDECKPDDPSVKQEIFGPIISLLKATDTEHMVRLANDSEYTLAASIWTKSLSRAHSMANQVNAGIVWINAHHLNDPSSPWGGWGPSGMGKENGRVAFRDYIREKSVIVNLEERSKGWFEDQNARYS